jgi:hypothetical protein
MSTALSRPLQHRDVREGLALRLQEASKIRPGTKVTRYSKANLGRPESALREFLDPGFLFVRQGRNHLLRWAAADKQDDRQHPDQEKPDRCGP